MRTDFKRPKDKAKDIYWALDFAKEHYGWITALCAFLASFAGVASLSSYSLYIGRPDVFLRSLEFGPSLAILFVACFLLFVGLVGSMLVTSYVFSSTISFLKPEIEQAKTVVRWLFGMTAAAMAVLILVVLAGTLLDYSTAHLGWAFLSLIPLVGTAWKFFKVNAGKLGCLPLEAGTSRKILACALLVAALELIAFLGIFPASVVAKSFVGPDTILGLSQALIFSFITMQGSLFPAVVFHMSMAESRLIRFRLVLASVFGFIGVLTITAPAMFGFVSVGGAHTIGLSDLEQRHYLISSDKYPIGKFDKTRWNTVEDQEKKFIIDAISLYSFGSVELLCPANLRLVKAPERRKYTQRCVRFTRSAITVLDAVDEADRLNQGQKACLASIPFYPVSAAAWLNAIASEFAHRTRIVIPLRLNDGQKYLLNVRKPLFRRCN